MSLVALIGSLELGLIYAVMALGVFLSFRTLNTPDLTVDGSFVTGAACSAIICSSGGSPFAAILIGFIAGCLAGCVTALLNTKLQIQPLLAGILVMLALYSANLRIMGGKANISLMNVKTIYDSFDGTVFEPYGEMMVILIVIVLILVLLYLFLQTRMGFALRATGDNEYMVRASGINTNRMKLIGMAVANGLVATSGAMIAQFQSYADVGMGLGMVVIGLASVIIGEVIFGTKTLLRRLIAVVLGAVLYRTVIAFALGQGMPATDLKLISAVVVTIALSIGIIMKYLLKYYRQFAASKVGKPIVRAANLIFGFINWLFQPIRYLIASIHKTLNELPGKLFKSSGKMKGGGQK